jgi:hypothetical protein
MDMQGPITRARAQCPNLQESSFLYIFCNYENGMLPNDSLFKFIMEVPHMDMQGPITRARAQRPNLQESSFLYIFCNYENGMLPNDVIVLRNNGED